MLRRKDKDLRTNFQMISILITRRQIQDLCLGTDDNTGHIDKFKFRHRTTAPHRPPRRDTTSSRIVSSLRMDHSLIAARDKPVVVRKPPIIFRPKQFPSSSRQTLHDHV